MQVRPRELNTGVWAQGQDDSLAFPKSAVDGPCPPGEELRPETISGLFRWCGGGVPLPWRVRSSGECS